ncbi:MAG: enoyl-CoA hydratase-related protein [Oscillochloridaceae bacterium umkhey_bin13]
MHDLITLTRTGPVATLTLQRPALHNAFNPELIAAIHAACTELATDPTVRVVVLQGAGPSFCAGADLNWMRASQQFSHTENLADAARLDAMLAALNGLPQAVIGRIHGAALGGGVGLVACCDLVIAAEEARFGLTEVRLGLLPAVIARFVVAKIGPSHARALFTTGRRFTASHALSLGLVHEVVPATQLDLAVDRATNDLLHCGPQAVAASKALIAAVTSLDPATAAEYAIRAIAAARTSPEGQEGLSAFLSKRSPTWVPSDPA